MSLRDYVRKRDFQRTAEPEGKEKKAPRSGNLFVIQKHEASSLHYDFRLELDGTLKSWAVPKGVPFQKGDKRLAVEVEDHPVAYAGFEGIIPEGEYGGGTVMVWDTGTYEALGEDPLKELEKGKLHFALKGEKLSGEWTLVKTRRGNQWLLIKSGEDMKPVSKKRDDESALTGRTMARIATERGAAQEPKPAKPRRPSKPKFVEPMTATLVNEVPSHGEWIYEIKLDGYRALALKVGRDVHLMSRNAKDFARRFPDIVEAIAGLPVNSAILDGEIVAMDAKGRPSFQLLQASQTSGEEPPMAFYLFDLLSCDGIDLTGKPLHQRRSQLELIVKDAPEPIRFSASLKGQPERLLEEVRKHGLEGLIGKQLESVYEIGRRSKSWIKLKCVHEQEFVIGGYTPPDGARKHFGALLVGVFEKKKLRFVGKVGTGFNADLLGALHRDFKQIEQENCPFSDLPEKKQGRWAQNITPAEMKLCHWVKPGLVCQIRFTEWTNDGKLRHPVFLGLREDKEASEVVRELPAKLR
ncbi:MAG: ATP-dependent ligase [Chthoniobacteraceae bacterium]|nr:ATP-dependent ligase [Chthoniobacteraceae bacterium]